MNWSVFVKACFTICSQIGIVPTLMLNWAVNEYIVFRDIIAIIAN